MYTPIDTAFGPGKTFREKHTCVTNVTGSFFMGCLIKKKKKLKTDKP